MEEKEKMDDIEEDITDKIEKEPEEKEPWYTGPVRIILALFLLLLIILWTFSYYGVKVDPEPSKIPTIEDVVPSNLDYGNSSNDYNSLVKPNDPMIKQVADKISTHSCSGSRICQAKAIYYFVRNNFDYVSDPNGYEYIKSARESLVNTGGDCDDAAVLLANLLEAIGIETEFMIIPRHVFIKARMPELTARYIDDNGWVYLDATCKTCDFGIVPYGDLY